MKTFNTIKFLTVSIIASSLLVGCGGGGSSTTTNSNSITISGVASDPELQGAKIYLDINANGQLDTNEINTTTKIDGSYTLTIPKEDIGKSIIVEGGLDKVTKEPFTGKLTMIATQDITNNISPITTLVEQYHMEKPDVDISQIEADIATSLDISVNDLYKDITKEGNEALLSIALHLEKVAQLVNDNSQDIQDNIEVYQKIATKLKVEQNITNAIDGIAEDIFSGNALAKAKILDLNKELSNYTTEISTNSYTKEEIALSIDNIGTKIDEAQTETDLNEDLYNNTNLIITTPQKVEETQRDNIYKLLGLDSLSSEDKDALTQKLQDKGVDFKTASATTILDTIKQPGFFSLDEIALSKRILGAIHIDAKLTASVNIGG